MRPCKRHGTLCAAVLYGARSVPPSRRKAMDYAALRQSRFGPQSVYLPAGCRKGNTFGSVSGTPHFNPAYNPCWAKSSSLPLISTRRESRQMATGDLALGQEQGSLNARQRVVNDFSIIVATVNGSGSQSANSVLLKSIFGMGVPVSGKNLFPSNIAGLPTWYTIRASKDGYVARKRGSQILIALNPETAKQDMLELDAGGAAIYEESFNLKQHRADVVSYPVPFDKITAAICPEAKLRKLVKNMVYVGVVAQILQMDLATVEAALRRQFA